MRNVSNKDILATSTPSIQSPAAHLSSLTQQLHTDTPIHLVSMPLTTPVTSKKFNIQLDLDQDAVAPGATLTNRVISEQRQSPSDTTMTISLHGRSKVKIAVSNDENVLVFRGQLPLISDQNTKQTLQQVTQTLQSEKKAQGE